MPKFNAGDDVYVGGKKISTDYEDNRDNAPSCGSPQLDAGDKIFRFVFDKPIFKYLVVEATFKAGVTLSTNGTTFSALASADTVTIDGKVLIVTFDSALTGATNKIKLGASIVQDVHGNTNAEYTTSAITLI